MLPVATVFLVASYILSVSGESSRNLNRYLYLNILANDQFACRRIRRKWNKGFNNRIAETERVYVFDFDSGFDGELFVHCYFILTRVQWRQKTGLFGFYCRSIFSVFYFIKVVQVSPTFPVPIILYVAGGGKVTGQDKRKSPAVSGGREVSSC